MENMVHGACDAIVMMKVHERDDIVRERDMVHERDDMVHERDNMVHDMCMEGWYGA